jgi:hypothetical protein
VQARTQVEELAEERRTKVEAFEHWKFFQVLEESAPKLRRSNSCRRMKSEEIWTIEGFHIQEAVQEERTGR